MEKREELYEGIKSEEIYFRPLSKGWGIRQWSFSSGSGALKKRRTNV